MKEYNDLQQFVEVNPNVLGGTPVFNGTRVPLKILFDHIENNLSIEEFLEGFPTVTREQAIGIVQLAQKKITPSHNI